MLSLQQQLYLEYLRSYNEYLRLYQEYLQLQRGFGFTTRASLTIVIHQGVFTQNTP